MLVKVVMMYLITWNCDTGTKLAEYTKQMPEFSVSGDRIEDCRKEGVAKAKELTAKYKAEYNNVSTNVDCQWEDGKPEQPAQEKM